MNFYSVLSSKINKRSAKIAIIGLGYVGLPLVLQFAKKKFDVIGFDIDKKKINDLKKKRSYIKHIPNTLIKKFSKKLFFTDNFRFITKCNIIILCLPTPLTNKFTPDLSYIQKTLKNIKNYLENGQLLILESSTYPGSTRSVVMPYLKKFEIGKKFFLGYSPEREDPNNTKYKLENIPKICSGYSIQCLKLTSLLYSKILKKIVKVTSLETAEFVKLYENIYRSVNIGLVNEMKVISNKLGLNIHEIIEAAKSKPFGFQAFYPGPGVGGHCIPVDPYYLSWIAKKNKINTNLIYDAGRINSYMPKWIISNSLLGRNIRKTLIIGIAYKKDLDDTREAPAINFINILNQKKIKVEFHDPNIKILKSRKLKKIYKSVEITSKSIQKYDCVIIVTDHSNIDYNLIRKNAKLIVDTRNVYKSNYKNVLKL